MLLPTPFNEVYFLLGTYSGRLLVHASAHPLIRMGSYAHRRTLAESDEMWSSTSSIRRSLVSSDLDHATLAQGRSSQNLIKHGSNLNPVENTAVCLRAPAASGSAPAHRGQSHSSL